jgi:transposase-like protein
MVTLANEAIRDEIGTLVKNTVQDVLNVLLDEEADALVNAERYERTADRKAYRSGHYKRNLTTATGPIELSIPKLRGATFQSAIIERYRRRETSVEEAMIEMYLAGVSTRRIEDISEILWGTEVSSSTVSTLNQKAYGQIEKWRSRQLQGSYPVVYVDGIYTSSAAGEVRRPCGCAGGHRCQRRGVSRDHRLRRGLP